MTITGQQIQVRKVTHWQPTYVYKQGEDGTYTFQLILDNGAAEYVMTLGEDDADNLFDWLSSSSEVYFDMERKVLMFGTRAVGS
ncbi:MAG: hypothetical protein H0U32_11660 [Thermoleophilaceae bacterium]|nr:hypothetical protein [Thermoleophilaceae bacterium]